MRNFLAGFALCWLTFSAMHALHPIKQSGLLVLPTDVVECDRSFEPPMPINRLDLVALE